jgi:hypothetical protein
MWTRRREQRGCAGGAPPSLEPAGEQSVPEVQACGRVGMEKGATGEPATPS